MVCVLAAIAGVPVAVSDHAGGAIAGCVTGADGRCSISVAAGQTVIVTHDVAAIPAPYRPLAGPWLVRLADGGLHELFLENARAARAEPSAGGDARLTVHSRVCPPGYRGDDPFGDCHETPPGYAQTIRVASAGPVRTEVTDGDGNAAFAGLPSGIATVELIGPPEIGDLIVFCSAAEEPGQRLPARGLVAYPGPPGDVRFEVALLRGEDVVCDAYALPRVERRFAEVEDGLLYDRAALRLVARICPSDVPAPERYARCTDPEALRPFAIDTFAANGPAAVSLVTDRSGEAVAVFEYAEQFRLRLESGERFAADSVECADAEGAPIPVTLDAEGALVEPGGPGESIRCTWFLVARG